MQRSRRKRLCGGEQTNRPQWSLLVMSWINEAPGDETGLLAVTWREWARETINAIRNGPDDGRETAVATLHKLTDYLDCRYDGGYHGIEPMPLAECQMGWDW